MNKQLGGVLLVAGTCIGGGMIALPLSLASLGLIPGFILMVLVWGVSYYSALLNLELNLQAGQGLTLGALGKRFSGWGAQFLGETSLKSFSYVLLTFYLGAGASILKTSCVGNSFLFDFSAVYALFAFLVFTAPPRMVDYLNRVLFMMMIAVIFLFIIVLLSLIQWNNLPLWPSSENLFKNGLFVLPVIFTSFGFQVIFHSLMEYCGKDSGMLKRVFFWGSLIPAIIYALWTIGALSVVYQKDLSFYQVLQERCTDVGVLVQKLGKITDFKWTYQLVEWFSWLAITTSLVGVGLGLVDGFNAFFQDKIHHPFLRRVVCASLTVLPAYGMSVLLPAIVNILGLAGMILSFFAILIPLYLLQKGAFKSLNYTILNNKNLLYSMIFAGILIMTAEAMTLWIK